jgi:hypothetical protein
VFHHPSRDNETWMTRQIQGETQEIEIWGWGVCTEKVQCTIQTIYNNYDKDNDKVSRLQNVVTMSTTMTTTDDNDFVRMLVMESFALSLLIDKTTTTTTTKTT